MNFRGDVEIRFLTKELLDKFLVDFPAIELENKKFSCGKKVHITQYNYARYYIRFFLTGDIEINDVLDELKKFGKIVEMTWKT